MPPRFFVPVELELMAIGGMIALPPATAHHAVRVLRLGVGDRLTLFNGHGGEFAATLTQIDKRGASVRIDAFDPVERESPLKLVLAQSVAAHDAMDYALRKAVELGVHAIQPIVSARSAPTYDSERGEKRLAHWRQIAIAACEQCGRNRSIPVAAPLALAAWLGSWPGEGIVLLPEATSTLIDLPQPTGELAIAVGPEGGWDKADIALLQTRRFMSVRLGPRVLRCETAGVAALTALQMLWGDYR